VRGGRTACKTMKSSLQPGLTFEFRFTVPESKTVPHLYPESALFQDMPHVLATGYLVGLMEWACIEALRPHLEWPREQSLGTHVDFSHVAATPPGRTVTIAVRLDRIDGRKLYFTLSAHDGVNLISQGTHERHVIDVARFNARLASRA
jgi:fluoroacetyl-CoA thioesterase